MNAHRKADILTRIVARMERPETMASPALAARLRSDLNEQVKAEGNAELILRCLGWHPGVAQTVVHVAKITDVPLGTLLWVAARAGTDPNSDVVLMNASELAGADAALLGS